MWSRRGAAAERGQPLRAPLVGPGEQPRAGPGEGGGGDGQGLCVGICFCVLRFTSTCAKSKWRQGSRCRQGLVFSCSFPKLGSGSSRGFCAGGREVGVRESSILEAVLGREFSEAGVGDEEGQGL